MVGPETQLISSASSSPSSTTRTLTIRAPLGLTRTEPSCCDFGLVSTDVFRSSDGLAVDKMARVAREASAREIITAAAELLDSDNDTIRFGMRMRLYGRSRECT